jgi:hypothetical protein
MPLKRKKASKPHNEGRLLLALNAYQNGQISSIRAAAATYDIPYQTLRDRVHGRKARVDISANRQKLLNSEESSLKKWILDMDQRGLPPTHATVRKMANLLLSNRKGLDSVDLVSERWVTRFIHRHDELQSKYNRKYDYQRAQCEDPEVIKDWFTRVQNTIAKYGILEQDIYNFDETGFQMGVASTAKVVTGSYHTTSRVRALQPGNREWVTVIESINASGWILPPMVIFAGKVHQSLWYQDIPTDWIIGLSENGWTNDDLGFQWLKEVFDKHTASRTIGRYRLLILDGHSSHNTAEFDFFCKSNQIIPLYMPAHSSHLLQPLDVSCFAPLKQIYGRQIQINMEHGINHIDKQNFLAAYQHTRVRALSSANICSGFTAAGLVPHNPQRVLDSLDIQVKEITPPSTSYGPSQWTTKTPHSTAEVQKQMQLIKGLIDRHSHSPPNQALGQLAKACETTIHEVIMLRQQVQELHTANHRQKRKREAVRSYIATGGILTGAQGQQLAQEAEQVHKEAQMEPRKRAPPRCSKCQVIGHIRTSCPSK